MLRLQSCANPSLKMEADSIGLDHLASSDLTWSRRSASLPWLTGASAFGDSNHHLAVRLGEARQG